jgi:ATP-dependent Clp protease adaptor protein ClpS
VSQVPRRIKLNLTRPRGTKSSDNRRSILKIKDEIQIERPRLHKVILLNADYTPREFVVLILKAEFRINEGQALHIMMTADRRGSSVVAVFTKDIAEVKVTRTTGLARNKGYPLLFTTESEERNGTGIKGRSSQFSLRVLCCPHGRV